MKFFRLLLFFIFAATWAKAETISLFDGKSLDLWEGDFKMWRAEAGEIRGGSLTEEIKRNDFLATKKLYQNFDLRLKIKVTGTGFVNSGIQIRSVRVPGNSEMSGYQVDAGKDWWGKLYDESRRNKVISESLNLEAINQSVVVDGWNEYRIRAVGPRIQSWINGVISLDYTENNPNIAQDGKIGIQVHSGGKVLVQVKDITIEELPATPNVPTWANLGGYEGVKIKLQTPVPTAEILPAEEQQKRFKLPEGFDIELVAKESDGIGKFIAVTFDQKGRLWTMTALEYPVDANENPAAAEALYESHARDKVVIIDHPYGPGPHTPRIWADGLAIPEGVLPYRDGAIVQHGPDIVFLRDTDQDGKADKRDVLLTGFGIQDSHLFPHQFTRAPGGWIWLAQGAFNRGTVMTTDGQLVQFDQTRMARFKPDGTSFEITSQGPCNIWGLVLTGEGESFIQEANDYGYPVMPFHEYANYPGCSNSQWKSYAPEFPVAAPDFKMGGTGLSGLALSDKGVWPEPFDDVMYVANPITSRIQAIKMHRDGPRWKLEKLPDFIECSDPFFRPVGMTMGPDGCLYIVDWYNKIISHNEVARNHPDRDKSHGRIWRVRPKSMKKIDVPDFTQLTSETLVGKLGNSVTAQAHLAWQTLADRESDDKITNLLNVIISDEKASSAKRIQALWVLREQSSVEVQNILPWLKAADRNLRRQAIDSLARFKEASAFADTFAGIADDPDPEVRAAAIRALGLRLDEFPTFIAPLLSFAKGSREGPTAPSKSRQQIKIDDAYDREFERYLVRMFLEAHPDLVSKFLDSEEAAKLPLEARLLASLALEPRVSAPRVARLLPQLDRSPNDEELFRLAQFPEETGVKDALNALLTNPALRAFVVEKLLAQKTKLDPVKISPLLTEPTRILLHGSDTDIRLATTLIGAFQLTSLETELVRLAQFKNVTLTLPALQALREIRSAESALFTDIVKTSEDVSVREAALDALAASKAKDAPKRLFELYADLTPAQQRNSMTTLASTKSGAQALVSALTANEIPRSDLDAQTAERLSIILGDDPAFTKLMQSMGSIFRPVLFMDGQETAVPDTKLTLNGPFTVETWVRLVPEISNEDGILGGSQIDINFFASKLRVWVGGGVGDVVVAKKPITPDLWTHVAVSRNAQGKLSLYQNGELDAQSSKAVLQTFEDLRIGWTQHSKGTKGSFAEYRVWDHQRTTAEIRATFDRSFAGQVTPKGLTFYNPGGASWGKLGAGARIAKTTDYPPLLTAQQAEVLDMKFAMYSALGAKGGNMEEGKMLSIICMACHQINGQGGNIGPDLSGAGAMGLEGVLRNILTPNAAMEPGYRIFRVEFKNGDVIDSFFVSEDAEAIVIRQAGTPDRRIAKAEIRTTRFIRRSLMPEGLLDSLTNKQVASLLGYLMTLK